MPESRCRPTRWFARFLPVAPAVIFIVICIALWIQSQPLPSQSPFSLSPDLDGAEGDQGVTSLDVSAEDIVSIQVFGDDIQGATAVSIRGPLLFQCFFNTMRARFSSMASTLAGL